MTFPILPAGDVPNIVESPKTANAGRILCGIGEGVNCQGGGLTVTMVLKGGLEHRQMLVGLGVPDAALAVYKS